MEEQEKSEPIVCGMCGAPLDDPAFSDTERRKKCCDACYSAEVNAFENFGEPDPDAEEGRMENDGEEDLEPEDDDEG